MVVQLHSFLTSAVGEMCDQLGASGGMPQWNKPAVTMKNKCDYSPASVRIFGTEKYLTPA
jgi:hypothetical protein